MWRRASRPRLNSKSLCGRPSRRMNPKYLGDSYDVVKHCLIRWLAPLGTWTVHPMFTDRPTRRQVRQFQSLVGAKLLSTDVLRANSDRKAYFSIVLDCQSHVFLDPDTGLRRERLGGIRSPRFVFGDELLRIARRNSRHLTLLFDQSLGRGRARLELRGKLRWLRREGLAGFGYCSHASFLLVGRSSTHVRRAHRLLLRHLPGERFEP